jgi:hypothetical protein
MAITVLTGKASRVTKGQRITQGVNDQGVAVTPTYVTNVVGMLIDEKPVNFLTRATLLIQDGDKVAAAGIMKKGILDARALRNDSTGVIYYYLTPSQANMQIGGAALLALCGLKLAQLMPMLAPIAIILFGWIAYWVFNTARKAQKSAKALGG